MAGQASIPDRAESITPAWLEEALQERHPGARVESVGITDRAEVTNNHAWLRVRYANPAGCPESLFCKLLPVEPARRAAIAATGMGLREARFYAELAPLLQIRVPQAFVARYDAGDGRFVLLLEDLRAAGPSKVTHGETHIRKLYFEALSGRGRTGL
ncbi:ecdysteroid 22-kinase family protein, partial [Myxococcota bacterium]|nr:ecdysteroid 22-kinase family protein [Myxococcota bacterium]